MKTLKQLYQMHHDGEKISALVVFDATFATLSERSGIDCVIVCDRIGTMISGYPNALSVNLAQISYHAAAVARGAPNLWRIVDMPFLSYDTPEEAVKNATLLLNKGHAHMIRIKALGKEHAEIIRALKDAYIPVCAHLTYGHPSKDEEIDKKRLRLEALMFESEGADLLILDSVPESIASDITQAAKIPVLGADSGINTSGQVLSAYDVIGINLQREHQQRSFLNGNSSIEAAIAAYHAAVKNQHFP